MSRSPLSTSNNREANKKKDREQEMERNHRWIKIGKQKWRSGKFYSLEAPPGPQMPSNFGVAKRGFCLVVDATLPPDTA